MVEGDCAEWPADLANGLMAIGSGLSEHVAAVCQSGAIPLALHIVIYATGICVSKLQHMRCVCTIDRKDVRARIKMNESRSVLLLERRNPARTREQLRRKPRHVA